MVLIITGPIRGGKSTLLLALYRAWKTGDGFFNQRVIDERRQAIICIKTGEIELFACRRGAEPPEWEAVESCQDTTFSRKGLDFAERILLAALKNGSGPIWVDEIGPLELGGGGISSTFQTVIESGRHVVMAVREACMDEVIDFFKLKNPVIIRTAANGPASF